VTPGGRTVRCSGCKKAVARVYGPAAVVRPGAAVEIKCAKCNAFTYIDGQRPVEAPQEAA
jgi:phage FluMu protein Com